MRCRLELKPKVDRKHGPADDRSSGLVLLVTGTGMLVLDPCDGSEPAAVYPHELADPIVYDGD